MAVRPGRRPSVGKAPRRTAQRILQAALAQFNRFGEPNVSTSQIAAELRISPGNLHYHYRTKDDLVNALFGEFDARLAPLLEASHEASALEDAWFVLHSLFELIWQYRFLYRDLNHLLGKNRLLESRFQSILQDKARAMRALLAGLSGRGILSIETQEIDSAATSMVLLLSYWLSYEFVLDPRHALEDANADHAMLRGARQALGLLTPYVNSSHRAHMQALCGAYEEHAAPGLPGSVN